MNSGCSIPIEIERDVRGLLENDDRKTRALMTSAAAIEWPRDEQSTTTPTLIGPTRWFCLFCGDAGPMAIAVESVAEVLETDTLIRLAWSPPQVVGMCSYHRDVIPVVKLGPLERNGREEVVDGHDETVAIDSAGEIAGLGEPTPRVVLILKTEHGAWGIRIDSANTIMSREPPERHPPRMHATGLVLIGIIRHAGTCYAIVDAEATWRGLRSAVGRWSVVNCEPNPSALSPSGEEPIVAGPGAPR